MVETYLNKELAEAFGVDVLKWRRWSRDFLPPDPVAGSRSGHARRYSETDALTVFLAGLKLVGERKMSIPSARAAIQEIMPWLESKGLLPITGHKRRMGPGDPLNWEISVMTYENGAIYCQAKGILDWEKDPDQEGVYIERYKLEDINEPYRGADTSNLLNIPDAPIQSIVLSLTAEINEFRTMLGISA